MTRTREQLWAARHTQQARLTELTYERRHLHTTPTDDVAGRAVELDYLITYTQQRITQLSNQICDATRARQPC